MAAAGYDGIRFERVPQKQKHSFDFEHFLFPCGFVSVMIQKHTSDSMKLFLAFFLKQQLLNKNKVNKAVKQRWMHASHELEWFKSEYDVTGL